MQAVQTSSSAAVQAPDPGAHGLASPTVGSARLQMDWMPVAALDAAGATDWSELARRALEPNVFLEPAFACGAAVRFGGAGLSAIRVRAGGRLVGFLPGRVEGTGAGRPVTTFVAWTHPFAPLSTPLVDRETDGSEVVGALLEMIARLPGSPRLALFPLLDDEGRFARLLARVLEQSGRTVRRLGPHRRAVLAPGNDPLAAVSGKKRKELRRLRRRLEEAGALVHATVTDVDTIDAAISDYLDVEMASWKGRAGSAAKLDEPTARFLSEAVWALAAEGKARVDFLKLDGKAIAATITLFSGNRAWFWKTAYDEAFARFSPGVLLALELTEALASDPHISLVDSCAVADHPMIDHLWDERLAIADWLVPLGGGAACVVGVAMERARRAVLATAKLLRGRLRD